MAGKANIMREFLSVKELSAYAGICERSLRDLINASTNPIPAYRFGGSIKVKRSEFDEWAVSCRIDNGRFDRIVNEVLTDLGIKGNGRKSKERTKKRDWRFHEKKI
jgi:excisionase family DNA binding protein